MEFKEMFSKLTNDDSFKSWNALHKTCFLAHAFVMKDDKNVELWQFGYYNPASKKMTTFLSEDGKIRILAEQDVLESGNKIETVNPKDVVISVVQMKESAEKVLKEMYNNQPLSKSFFIIQNIEGKGPLYNLTYFTMTFKTINIKINSLTGDVVEHTIMGLADFDKK